ncbi:uncharacterized protein A4U43_C01F32660 [Asparagus officinalis]|uniref:Uncharacterized protein n=1 Tax=Asparagus officinalis TaxID=4686 RepID=A0A5P1FTX5_ASPOF|nr:uncharacterized protein A4U43_C01F32660 [Asparagus officinalis]
MTWRNRGDLDKEVKEKGMVRKRKEEVQDLVEGVGVINGDGLDGDEAEEADGSREICTLLYAGYIGDVPIMLAKPQTFMNSSGESVGSLISYFKVPLNQVLLIYDDMDLPFAKLRLLPKGIGRPPGKMDPVNFVLRPFCKKEQEELDFTFQRGLDALRILVLEGFNKSATFTNSAQPSELLS